MPAGEQQEPVFNWSPLPQRKYLTRKHENSLKGDKILFPNCDNLLWLRSCDKEVLEPLEGVITGEVPKWLNGVLIRNGPGSFKVGDYTYEHLFDSAALLHRFHISKGKITYQCRFLQSDVFKRNMAAKRIVFTEFGTKAVPDPCQTIFSRISSLFTTNENMSDNAMITVYPFGDELYAFPETPVIHKVNKCTLATEGKVYINKHVAVVNHTSHPHIMNDGTVYNLAMSIGLTGPIHRVIRFPNNKTSEKNSTFFKEAHFVAEVPARWRFHPSYMHTFGITENYFIIVEQPLNLSLIDLVKCKYHNEPLIGAFNWFPEEKTKFNILCRKTGKALCSFLANAFFYLHIINQYEIDDYVVIDICCYRDPTMLECMYVEALKNLHKNPDYAKMFRGRPLRFVLPLNIKSKTTKNDENVICLENSTAEAYLQKNGEIFVLPEKLCDLGCETPRINSERSLGKIYQFFYAISADVDATNPGTLIKVDVVNKQTKTWCEDNCYPSEPVFVPQPNNQDEDDGILLSALLWGNNEVNRVGLLILDAKTMKEIGRAEFRTPGVIPKCLHGWFIAE
ncbi:Retinal pigment epithelial membrane protein [Popillia japonica]|uniref:Retinal pigment epithelial membrane protein n=1 Tax=Popillia japonica TaxID=7064 RepID=A0AAW1L5W0_POPJA